MEDLAHIRSALETVHNPAVSNAQRHNAQGLLESVKLRDDAPLIGYTLSHRSNPNPGNLNDSEKKLDGEVRHFGLALLGHSIATQFQTWGESNRLEVRNCIVQLAFGITENDPHYIREKIACLWVELAKRVWGVDARIEVEPEDVAPTDGWINMDSQLLELWKRSKVDSEFVLSVLRNLFEDIYLLEDPISGKRAGTLGSQTIEIVASVPDLEAIYSSRAPELSQLRGSQTSPEGWLSRFSQAVSQQAPAPSPKLLETIRATLQWCPASAIISSHILDVLAAAMKTPDVEIRILVCDCLHVLFCARNWSANDFEVVVATVFLPDGVRWLKDVYKAPPEDDLEDDMEYVFSKKYIELIVALGDLIENPKAPGPLPEAADLHGFCQVVLSISQHPSLLASGMSLQFWCSVLRHEKLLENHPELEQLLPELLQIASKRCIKYENLPSSSLTKQYMDVDFDAGPEESSFYGSYRRYMEDIVRLIVCRIPDATVRWLHEQMIQFFTQSQDGWRAMNERLPDHSQPAFIYGCAQLTIVEAAIRGVSRWQIWAPESDRESQNEQILALMTAWASEMLEMPIKDLVIRCEMVQCIVQFAPLLRDNKILLKILERVLEECTCDSPLAEDEEAVRDLRQSSATELNRLAYMVPEALSEIYDDLERVIGTLIDAQKVRPHESVSFKSFLLVVSQRSPTMQNKPEKFAKIVDSVLASWTDDVTVKGLTDLEWFMERLGIVAIAEYFRERGITASTNLLETPMDDRGRQLKTELKAKWEAMFPIRPSRIFIQYTIERLDHKSPEYLHLLDMWKPRIQPILPHILKLVAQIMAYHNPANWHTLPEEVQTFVRTSCTERFWQAGISMQTRDQFENESLEASKTLRDFADSVGHIVRYTREYAFLTLGSITQLEETLFEIPGVGQQLYETLAGSTEGITSHCWRHMISLVARNVVRNCPAQYTQQFMTDFLPPFLNKINQVLVTMWMKQQQLGFQMADAVPPEEDLSEEMMEEHLLRQLTAIVDRLLIDLVGQSSAKSEDSSENKAQLRSVCRQTPVILGAVLQLCKNIMNFQDGRCCFNTCLVVRHILTGPSAATDSPEVAQYFVTDIIPALLRILSDPFFNESHSEAGTILTLIYLQMSSVEPSPLRQLGQLLPSATPDRLDGLFHAMTNAKSLRQQRGILLEFLMQCQLLPADDQMRARNRRRVEQRVTRRNPDDTEKYDAAALISMFGDK